MYTHQYQYPHAGTLTCVCTHAHCSQCKQRTVHAKRLLQTLQMLLCNLCKHHSFQKDLPGGRLAALPISPLDQPSLYCPLFIQGMATETGVYCLRAKPHTLQDCPSLASSFPADMCSEEHQLIMAVCKGSKALHRRSSYTNGTSIMNLPDTFSNNIPPFLKIPPEVGSTNRSILGLEGCG